MTSWNERYEAGMRAIARPSGAFAMVAIDQRESLRAMFAETLPEPIELERRVAFKVAVSEILSPFASALLVDREEGLEPTYKSAMTRRWASRRSWMCAKARIRSFVEPCLPRQSA